MLWQLLPAPVIGGQVYSVPPTSTDEWAERNYFTMKKRERGGHNKQCSPQRKKTAREKILVQFWTIYVKDDFDLTNLMQTKKAFSDALAIMDRVGGWRFGHAEGSQVGARFAACMCLHTKADICNGQRHMETFRWKPPLGLVPAVKTTAIGSRNSPWYCRKPPFWRHWTMISTFRALCNGGCCGSRRQQVSSMTC